jgi:DNA polymerase-4
MLEKLAHIAEEVSKRLNNSKVAGKTVTLKIKYSDFSLQTRSKTLPYYINDKSLILETAKDLLYQEKLHNSVRLLGISMSNLNIESTTTKVAVVKEKVVSVQLKFEF